MLWRTYLLNRLVGPRDIIYMIWRHPVVYAKVVIQYIAVFLLLFFVRRVVRLWIPWELWTIIFGSIAWVCYLVGIYMILRWYFDVMVATKDHLYVVLWDSFFKYRIKIITRSSIQDISFIPASWISVLRKDSHVFIATEQDDLIEFHHVYQADEVVWNLYDIRNEYTTNLYEPEPEHQHDHGLSTTDDEKFKVLVETLWEVIVDYMQKKE